MAENLETVPQIFAAMVAVASELARVGVSKDRENAQQGFRFRGIDQVMNVVSPILAKHHVLFLPSYTDFPDVDRPTSDGKRSLIFAKVAGAFTFVCATDGSQVMVSTIGKAMDSGDKATNKAMSAALKYALLQTFLIPTESTDDDADATTPEASVPAPPAGFEAWFTELRRLAAEHGFEAIRVAWRDSPEPSREYAMAYRKDEWAATKRLANDVSEARKRAAEAAEDAAARAAELRAEGEQLAAKKPRPAAKKAAEPAATPEPTEKQGDQ